MIIVQARTKVFQISLVQKYLTDNNDSFIDPTRGCLIPNLPRPVLCSIFHETSSSNLHITLWLVMGAAPTYNSRVSSELSSIVYLMSPE